MKMIVKKIINHDSKIEEKFGVDAGTYDTSNDSDDTYYSFSNIEDLLKWLNRETN